jgi:archaellum component FlaG (FlaF/FlaG flagellin family)
MLIIDLPIVSYVIFVGVAVIFLFIVVVVFAAAHAGVLENLSSMLCY